jgi:hypothetical protein
MLDEKKSRPRRHAREPAGLAAKGIGRRPS